MIIKEYRIILPLTVDEFQIGQLYSKAEASKNETTAGEGVQILRNEPFENVPLLGDRFDQGQYTQKTFYIAEKVPSFVRILVPRRCLKLQEESWNSYPYTKTVATNPEYMKEDFSMRTRTMHCPDTGDQNNVHELPPDELEKREVVFIDIANDPVDRSDYKPEEDPAQFRSQKASRGPLVGNWQNSCSPVMCAYKLVTVEFKWKGLQNIMEPYIQKTVQRMMLKFHRQVFCWLDRWYGMSLSDIRELEDRTKQELDNQRNIGEGRGTND